MSRMLGRALGWILWALVVDRVVSRGGGRAMDGETPRPREVEGGRQGREAWDFGRQNAEQALRRSLVAQGIEIPRACPTCGAALEVVRDRKLGVIARCVGRCGRPDSRTALQHLRAAGASTLPGFE